MLHSLIGPTLMGTGLVQRHLPQSAPQFRTARPRGETSGGRASQ